jgi:acyl-CoA thioester hydrolase
MKSPQTSLAFTLPVRIYYEDTDAGGVVYYANYLRFFERCRTEWLRAIGFEQAAPLHDSGIAFVVRRVSLDYLKPARLDDLLTVGLEVEKFTRTQIFFRQYVRRDETGEELVSGTIQIVCVRIDQDAGEMKVTAFPAPLRAQLETSSR